jgi:hypothetical protein
MTFTEAAKPAKLPYLILPQTDFELVVEAKLFFGYIEVWVMDPKKLIRHFVYNDSEHRGRTS